VLRSQVFQVAQDKADEAVDSLALPEVAPV
jgi:hypothetical protein